LLRGIGGKEEILENAALGSIIKSGRAVIREDGGKETNA
jgi:hypothetical protein